MPTYSETVNIGTGGDMATPATVLALRAASSVDDQVRVKFLGDGGGEYARIQGTVLEETSTVADAGKLAFMVATGSAGGAGGPNFMQECLVIDKTGNIGIATSTPTASYAGTANQTVLDIGEPESCS